MLIIADDPVHGTEPSGADWDTRAGLTEPRQNQTRRNGRLAQRAALRAATAADQFTRLSHHPDTIRRLCKCPYYAHTYLILSIRFGVFITVPNRAAQHGKADQTAVAHHAGNLSAAEWRRHHPPEARCPLPVHFTHLPSLARRKDIRLMDTNSTNKTPSTFDGVQLLHSAK